jgi:hypothetical protein
VSDAILLQFEFEPWAKGWRCLLNLKSYNTGQTVFTHMSSGRTRQAAMAQVEHESLKNLAAYLRREEQYSAKLRAELDARDARAEAEHVEKP